MKARFSLVLTVLIVLAGLVSGALTGSGTVVTPAADNTLLSGQYVINFTFNGSANVTIKWYNGTTNTINTSNNETSPYTYTFNTSTQADAYQYYNLSILLINFTNASDNQTIWRYNLTVDNTAPNATLNGLPSPISGVININGTANDTNLKNYSVSLKNGTGVFVICNDTAVVNNATLCVWNTSQYNDDLLDYIVLDVYDNAGLHTNATFDNSGQGIEIENVAPVITPVDPTNDTFVNGSYNFTVTVENSGADMRNVTITNGTAGAALNMTNDSMGETEFNYSLVIDTTDFADGGQNFTITAFTQGMTNSTYLLQLKVDNTLPDAEIINMSPNGPYAGMVAINGTVNDTYLKNFTVTWTNSTGDTGTACATNTSGVSIDNATLCMWNTNSLPEGLYNLTLIAYDERGENNSYTTDQIMVDNENPLVTITTPSDGANLTGSFFINVTVTTGSGTGISGNTTVTNGTLGTPINMTMVGAGSTYTNYTILINSSWYADGSQTFTFNATDNTQNSNDTESITVIIDNSYPNASLVPPADNWVRGVYDVNGTANDTTFTNYTVQVYNSTPSLVDSYTSTSAVENGTLYTWNTSNGTFPDGGYLVKLLVRDALGRVNSTENFTAYVDNTPLVFDYFEDDTQNSSRNVSIGASMLAPDVTMLFVNLTDNTGVNVTLNHSGICIGLAPNQPLEYIDGDFNVSCSINKTVLAAINASNGTITFVVTANDTREAVTSNFTVNWDFARPTPHFTWWQTEEWNLSTNQSQPITLFNFSDLIANPDIFFSPGDNIINFSINVTDEGSGVANVSVNLSGLAFGGCDGIIPLALNGGLWTGNCSLGVFNGTNISLHPGGDGFVVSPQGGITFIIEDAYGNEMASFWNTSNTTAQEVCTSPSEECLPLNLPVVVHDFGVLDMGENCSQFGNLSTNLSQVTDFTDVNFVLDIEINLSCETGNPSYPSDYLNFVLFNFTTIDFSSPAMGNKLSRLADNINVTPVAPNSFGEARIYVNSTYFAELNTSTKISLYNLPFLTQPNVSGDPGASENITNITWSAGLNAAFGGITTGNLTFTVGGFSGYNVTDVTDPYITITTPANNSNYTTGNITYNVTVNGTGTGVSRVLFLLNGQTIGEYNNVTGNNTANCVAQDVNGEIQLCVFSSSTTNGSKQLNVTAWDYGGAAPGNSNTSLMTITVDTEAPTITVSSPANNTNTSDITPEVLFNATDNLDTSIAYTIYLDGAANVTGNASNGTVTSVNLSVAPGNYLLVVEVEDDVGTKVNSSTYNFTADNIAPTVLLTGPANNSNTSDSTPTIVLTITDNIFMTHTWRLFANGTPVTAVTPMGTGPQSYSADVIWSSALSDGTHNLTLQGWDPAGNTANYTNMYVTVDTVAPNLTVDESPTANGYANNSYILNGTVSDATSGVANVSIYLNGTLNGTATVAGGVWNYTVTASDGAVQNITVNASDNAGNSVASTILNVTVDGTFNTLTVDNPAADSTQTTSYTFNGTVSDAVSGIATVQVYVNGTLDGNATVNGTNWTYSVTGVHNTTQNLTIVATDNAGNTVNVSVLNITINDTTAPTISGISHGNPGETSATITWSTSESANTSLNYGTNTSLGTSAGSNVSTTAHSVTLTGLSANTQYFYNVTSCDAVGNCNTNGTYNFTTDAAATEETNTGGGGSGGGSTASGSVTLSQTPKIVTVSKYSIFRFTKGQSTHELRILEMGDDWVKIRLQSEPVEGTIKLGETEEFDLDADGDKDVAVTLESKSGYSAVFSLEAVPDEPPAGGERTLTPDDSETTVSATETPAQTTEEPAAENLAEPTAQEETPPPKEKSTNGSFWLWTIIIVVVVLGLLAFLMIKGRE